MKSSKNEKKRSIAERKNHKIINAIEVLRVKDKQMTRIQKTQSKNLLEKLDNYQDKIGRIVDSLDINMKSIEYLQSLNYLYQ